MSSCKHTALEALLHEAGMCWSTAEAIAEAVWDLSITGAGPDDVAGALFDWRKRFARRRLGEVRKKVEQIVLPQQIAEELRRIEAGEYASEAAVCEPGLFGPGRAGSAQKNALTWQDIPEIDLEYSD